MNNKTNEATRMVSLFMSGIIKLCRGKICVANFITPANGESLFCQKITFLVKKVKTD